MDNIREWLNGPKNYAEGARLYLIHGKDPALRIAFNEAESPFKKRRLEEALRGLLTRKVVAERKIEETKDTAIRRVAVADRNWPGEMDTTLTALWNKWKPLFAEMMNLSSRLYDVAKAGQTDPAMKVEAGRMAHRICDLDDECDAIYEKRDHYLKYKKLPEEKKPMDLVVDPKKIPLALANTTRYIRDYKNKLKKNPADVNAAKKLEEYEWAAGEYRKQLNLD